MREYFSFFHKFLLFRRPGAHAMTLQQFWWSRQKMSSKGGGGISSSVVVVVVVVVVIVVVILPFIPCYVRSTPTRATASLYVRTYIVPAAAYSWLSNMQYYYVSSGIIGISFSRAGNSCKSPGAIIQATRDYEVSTLEGFFFKSCQKSELRPAKMLSSYWNLLRAREGPAASNNT